MTDNPTFLNDMEFEERLTSMGDNQIELIKFVARQQYQTSKLCPVHSKEIAKLQSRSRKEIGIISGISSSLGMAVGVSIDFLLRR